MSPLSDQVTLRQKSNDALATIQGDAKPIPLFQVLFNHAEYYNVGAQLVQKHAENVKNPALMAPVILSSSFAVELLLKCFLVLPYPTVTRFAELHSLGVTLRGHRYSDLFDRIAPEHQSKIATAFATLAGVATDIAGFRGRLVELGDEPFVEWRYIYEDDGGHFISVELFRYVLDALGITAQGEVRRLVSKEQKIS